MTCDEDILNCMEFHMLHVLLCHCYVVGCKALSGHVNACSNEVEPI